MMHSRPKTFNMYGYADDFFSGNGVGLKIAGSWIPGNDVSLFKKILYYMYLYTIRILAMLYGISEVIILKDSAKVLFNLLANIGMLATHVVGVAKLYKLIAKRDKIADIMKSIQLDDFKYESHESFKPSEIFNKGKKVSERNAILLFTIYGCVGISAHISAYLNLRQAGYNKKPFDESTSCFQFMQYLSYIPFNVDTRTRCYITFFWMDIPLGIYAMFIACFDSIYGALCNCLTCQFRIVGQAFKTIRERTIKKMNLRETYNPFRDEDDPEFEHELYKEMVHCTKHVMSLFRARDEIEELFSYTILWQTTVTLSVFASCLYICSVVPSTSPEFFSQMEYFAAAFMQFSTYSWFGNQITLATAEVANDIYYSNWTSSSKRFKNAMTFNIVRLQRKMYLSIGKFAPISLGTLISVLRASFSYFTVLKSIES